MHRFLKLWPILVMFALLGALLPTSRAQDDNSTFDLGDDDYNLLQNAIDSTYDADSFQLTYSANLSLTNATSSDQTLDVAGSGTITHGNSPNLAIISSGTSANLGDLPASFNREVRYIDGVGYYNLIDVNTGDGPGWLGQAVAAPFIGASNLARLLVDGAAFTSVDVRDFVNFIDGIASLELRPYVSITRNEDATVKGETLAHFTATLDTESLFESPEFVRILINILAAAGQDPAISEDQMAAAGILLGSVFRGSELTVQLYVNDDDYLTEVSADFTLAIDPTLLDSEGSPSTANLLLDFSLSGFDGDYPVEAPADAQIVEGQTDPTSIPFTDGEAILSGSPVIVDLSGTADLQYNAATAEIVTITARSLDGTLDTTLDIYNASGDLLDSNDDSTSTLPNLSPTDSAIQDLHLPGEGAYTIRLGSFSGGASGQVEVAITASEAELLVPQYYGKVLFVDEPLKVYVTGQEAVDFVYQPITTETISVFVQNLDRNPVNIDTTLEVLNANGDQLAFNDDLTNANTDPGIENLELVPGLYTIRLYPYDADQIGGVQVELIVGESRGIGGGETSDADLEIGDSLTATIVDASTGEYRFNGFAGQVVTISAEATNPTSPDQDLQIILYDGDGDEIASDDDSGESVGLGLFDSAIVSFELPFDDTYLIVVDSIFDVSGDYILSVEEG